MSRARDEEPVSNTTSGSDLDATYASANEAIQQCAHKLLLTSAELAAEITEQVLAHQPNLTPNQSPEAVAAVRDSTDQNVGAILSTLAFGIPATATEPPLGARTLLRHVIHGGGEITDLLRAYHYGHGLVWRRWSEHVSRNVTAPDLLREVLTVSSAHMFTFVDRSLAHLVTEYHDEFGAVGVRSRQRHTSPADVVGDLLSEQPVDEGAASALLRYDVRAYHVALVFAPVEPSGTVRKALDQLHDHDPSSVLTIPIADGTYWVWLGWRSEPSKETLGAIARTPLADVLGGMSEVERGRAGFRRSHRQALEADRIARMGSSITGVVRYRDIELAAVLCTDPIRARQFADDRLGALGSRSETHRRLRETAMAFLAKGCNRTRTAQHLHVHHKTVSYRLSHAEELLGARLTDDPTSLAAALLIEKTLGGG